MKPLMPTERRWSKNRPYWVTGPTGTVRLPADYTSQHVDLGYAQTSHATQGRTVNTALLLVDTPTDSRSIYTPLTRGRHANHAYIAIADNQTPKDVLTQAIAREWADQPAHARRNQLRQQGRRAPGLSFEPEADERIASLRRALAEAELRREHDRMQDRGLGLTLDL